MTGSYSCRAQPYLDAIAAAVFTEQPVRDWLVAGTRHDSDYKGAKSLHDEQKAVRPPMTQPFYCNYHYGKDSRCTCRIERSCTRETDAMFFLESGSGRRLGIHVEFKHHGEPLSCGQADAYPERAECWARHCRNTVLPHDDWLTVIFCGNADNPQLEPFCRRIEHREAQAFIPDYPGYP